MGSRYRVGRLRKLHLMLLAAASLAMLSVSVTALSAQEVPGGATESPDPPGQPGPAQEPATGTPVEPLTQPPAEPPVEAPVEPSVGTPAGLTGTCDHAAGEFLVGYVSEEALLAAPLGVLEAPLLLLRHQVVVCELPVAHPVHELAGDLGLPQHDGVLAEPRLARV